MDAFVWDTSFAVGHDAVDAQHEHLIGLINRLGKLLSEQSSFNGSAMEEVFLELASYTRYHFREEEALMASMGIDMRHLEEQVLAHNQFLRELEKIREVHTPDDHSAAKPLLNFLTSWLVFHILGADRSLGRQVKAIEAGATPAEAFSAEQHPINEATIPLVKSFNELFDQLSKRNLELQELNNTLEKKVEERTSALLASNAELTRMIHMLEAEMQESRRLSDELARANQDLTLLAQTDALTGLHNRRHALNCLASLWEWDRKEEGDIAPPLSCILIDVDDFKRINDHFGHDAGDEVLRHLAQQLGYSVRNDDIVCRLGGDEFLIICPNTPLSGALHIAEKVRADVSKLRIALHAEEWVGSISVGVTARRPEFLRYDEMIKAADTALYEAKREGRNRVSAAGVPPIH